MVKTRLNGERTRNVRDRMTPRGAVRERTAVPRTPLTQSHLRATRQSMMREPCGVESCETSSFQMARNGQPQPRIARNRVARRGGPDALVPVDPGGRRIVRGPTRTVPGPIASVPVLPPPHSWALRALRMWASHGDINLLPLSRPSATTEYRPSRAIPEGASAPHVVYVCLICASMYAYREFRHIGKSRGIKTRT